MINFSALSYRSSLGRLARLPLRLVPTTATMRVLQGPLRGARWIAGSCDHGCWLGSFEADKQRLFAELVAPGDVVYDIGANVGFYTLLAARRVGEAGLVAAFEPLPRNLGYLREHVRLNGAGATRIYDAAVGDAAGTARFGEGPTHAMGALSDDGALEVRVVTVDDLVDREQVRPPTLLKIDVEGAEARVLRGARRTLQHFRPVVLLATHGPAVHAECLALLGELGYRVAPLGGESLDQASEVVARPT